MKKIGVLGGTFDPFHYGHLSIAKAALDEFHLDGICLLPNFVQPFKIGKKITSPFHRVNMVNLIAEKYPGFSTLSREAFSDEISYTYTTLKSLKDENPDSKFYFILGTDSFLSIMTWYKAEQLVEEFPIIVGERPGYKEEETISMKSRLEREHNAEIGILNNHILEISSTEIKERIRKGVSISDMVPQEIERYIVEHGLYR